MEEEPLQANAFRVKTFQETDEASLDAQVNDWLKKQSDDIVVFNVMIGHAMADTGLSFTMTIIHGSRPRGI